ncbi:hypothetical protein [Streptomyces sp. NPDC006971]|uniref:hypothetical protein n=1 Tax=Streptomyces sp. NPDC006971 TaxID=3154784 RepID=UPI00340F9E61
MEAPVRQERPLNPAGGSAPPGACGPPGGPTTQECAELPLPLDYRAPHGPRIGLKVTRVRGDRPSERRGTPLVIAGGPGSSGVQRETRGRYCIVGLDPRGVGGSAAATPAGRRGGGNRQPSPAGQRYASGSGDAYRCRA